MRTFLACAGIDGKEAALNALVETIKDYAPDAVLFAGGVYARPTAGEKPADAAERQREDVQLLERFFSAMSGQDRLVAIVPGPHDAPLRFFLHAATGASTWGAAPRVVHLATAEQDHLAVAGVGGEVTRTEDSSGPTIRCARVTADYFLRPFAMSRQSQKVLLLGAAASDGAGASASGDPTSELIDSLHPALCVVGGATRDRGGTRVAHTLIVNPGRLADGSAALVDWGREAEDQVQLIDTVSKVMA